MILITAKVHPFLLESFERKGYKYVYNPSISYEVLKNSVSKAEGLVVTTRLPIDKEVLQNAENLKWIGRLGSGMELIDVEFANSKGIRCVSSPEGNSNAVAEHALGMLLAVLRNITKSGKEIESGLWLRDENRGRELSGKTVGIIGFGNTGSAFAKLLSAFGCTVLAYDKFKFDFGSGYIKEATLDHVCRYSDVISFHVPLTSETQAMGGEEFFKCLQNKPVIINTSRGGVLNTETLLKALDSGIISGAALDVLENEKLDTLSLSEKEQLSQLIDRQNVILTPHIAGYTTEAFLEMSRVLLRKLDL